MNWKFNKMKFIEYDDIYIFRFMYYKKNDN